MKKLTALLVATAATMYFTGCGDAGVNANNGIMGKNTSSSSTGDKTGDKTGDSDTEKKGDYDESVEFTDELPKCTAKKDEKVYYVEEEDITYTCNYDEDLKMGEWVKAKKKAKKPVADETIESGDDLPKCNDKKDGDIYYIEDDDVYVSCDSDKGKWVEIDTDPDTDKSSSSKGGSEVLYNTVASLSRLPTCSMSIEGTYYYVTNEDDYYYCSGSIWVSMVSGNTYPETEPSSSSNGSSEIINTVSYLSSLPTCTVSMEYSVYYVTGEDDYYYCYEGLWWSSNTGDTYPKTESSSSNSSFYLYPVGDIPCGDMWCGVTGSEQVETGLGNDTETNGYWFDFDDSKDGGRSTILWPVPEGNEYSPDSKQPIIAECSGVCGTASLNYGLLDYSGFVGIGFNIVGEISASNHDAAAGDASAWGGVCIVYSSDVDLRFEMGLGDATDNALHGGPPSVTLPYGKMMVKNFSWSNFKMPNWAVDESGISITGPEAAEMLVSLKIIAQAANGQYGFNIMSIGKYGTCEY